MKVFKRAQSALISVFDKNGLIPVVRKLDELNIRIYSTGGTEQFIKDLGIDCIGVEHITTYPSILGGRVKTLHPKIFGGILSRRKNNQDEHELKEFSIPEIDIVIVDLYPFENTVSEGATEEEIIEKIDIGGISLIRAAAKNFKDVLCISSRDQYDTFLDILSKNDGTTIEDRRYFSTKAFAVSSHYDSCIYNYFSEDHSFSQFSGKSIPLRYGENPHQKAHFYGDLSLIFDQLHGKKLSFNNLLDIDAALNLMGEFHDNLSTFAILKHNNTCGFSQKEQLKNAYLTALSCDPISAFGGVLISNKTIDLETSHEIHKLFFEIIIAPDYENEALKKLKEKENRIILISHNHPISEVSHRSALNGVLEQETDFLTEKKEKLKNVTKKIVTDIQIQDLLIASKICKHTKSNAIVLVRDKTLCGSGIGQTSRIDALHHAIAKARQFKFDLKNAVMASDAFFPFSDCVEIAHQCGIESIIQPGGSIRDHFSIDYCDKNEIGMIFTGIRHFKH